MLSAFLGRAGCRYQKVTHAAYLSAVAERRTLTARSCSSTSSETLGGEQSAGPGGYRLRSVVAAGAIGVLGGVVISDKDSRLRQRTLPPNSFRTCCDSVLTDAQKGLPKTLKGIVGSKYVTEHYTQKGSRLGKGTSMVYVQPGTMQEAVDVLQACVTADVAVLPQGANTSLTGGSVVRNKCSDRPTVIVNLRRLNKILPIGDDAKQVLCFSGAGIFDLQQLLGKKFQRDSHSVLGSIFLNPSVGAGVAYGSGGTQIRKGPSWTQRALYCRVSKDGKVEVIDTLGLKAKGTDVFGLLEESGRESISTEDVAPTRKPQPASWPDYAKSLRNLSNQPSRFNADVTGIECCRSEGKVMILATIHDTFPIPPKSKLVWVSAKDYSIVHDIKRQVALASDTCMAKSCEYMNKEVFEGVDLSGRILIKAIELLGMHNLEPLWNLKLFIEMWPIPFSTIICDKFLWWFNNILPRPLPVTIQNMAKEYDHHLLMEFAEYSEGEVDRLTAALEAAAKKVPEGSMRYFVCASEQDKRRATLFRFVVAPAFRTYTIGRGLQGLSIDYALPKNMRDYPLLPEQRHPIAERWVYSHFGCNVYHEDLAFGHDVNVEEAKHDIKDTIEDQRGRLPAEHGHGVEYHAPDDMKQRWMNTDPLNVMNPGVGGTSWARKYAEVHQRKH